MSEFAIAGNEALEEAAAPAAEAFQMDEERFRAFYERTSRQLWGYLSRVSGDRSAADDMMQEAYYRLLRARVPEMGEAQLKSYLYRIASNLLHDGWRREKHSPVERASRTETEQREARAPGAAEAIER